MRFTFIVLFFTLLFTACNEHAKQIDTTLSSVYWRVTFGATMHEGIIPIKKHKLAVQNNSAAGFCELDMPKIQELGGPNTSDLSAIFIEHLKSNDFLKVDSFPTSRINFEPYTNDSLLGEFTILGQTKKMTIPYTISNQNDTISLQSTFNINRNDFNINKGGLLDQMGLPKDDTIQFKIHLIAY